jgi:hypothetical protein
MTMYSSLLILAVLFAAGCATPHASPRRPLPASEPILVTTIQPTRVVETRYDLRGYRDGIDASLRHEPHSVYRRTRVPVAAADELSHVPRETHPPASIAPLPASEELAAELATQKALKNELRAMQTALADAEQKMKAQYAALVQQSVETTQLREQLEAERNRLRTTPTSEIPGVATTTTTPANAEVRW